MASNIEVVKTSIFTGGNTREECAASIEEAEAMVDKVICLLGLDDLGDGFAERGYWITKVVHSLEGDFGAAITGIYTDQWTVVKSHKSGTGYSFIGSNGKPIPPPSGWEEKLDVVVECYIIEYGIAKTWLVYYERFPQLFEGR